MLLGDWRLKGWEKPRYFSLSLCLRQHFLGWPDFFQDFSSLQTSFLSLVPVSSVVIALASTIVPALIGQPCLLPSGNITTSCYPSCLMGDSGFLLLLISGLSCHRHASCFLSYLCNQFQVLNSLFEIPRLVYFLD